MPKRSPHHLWLLIPLLILAMGLAARSLNADAIWYDEYWSLLNVGSPPQGSRTLLEIWQTNLATNLWEPPGYYLLLASWGAFAGWTHFASRMLSLLFGLLSIAMTYRLGRDLFSPLAGLGAAVTLGASAFYLDYFHEMRSYTIFVLLMAFLLWAYWRIVTRQARGRALSLPLQAGFVLGAAAFLYLHYYAVVPLAAIALCHLLFVRKNRAWRRIAILMGLGGALFLPWAGSALQGLAQAADGPNYIIPTLTPEQVVRLLAYTFSNASAALLAIVIGMALTVRSRALAYVLFGILAVLLLMLLVDARLKILIHIRHMLALWPLLALVAGVGIARMARGGIPASLTLSVWIAAGVIAALTPAFVKDLPNTEPRLQWAAWKETLAVLRERATPQDVIVFHVPAGDGVLGYYMDREGIGAPFRRTESFFGPQESYQANARDFMRDAARVWYITAPEMPPFFQREDFMAALTAEHVYCDAPVNLVEVHVDRYARPPAQTGPYRFGEGITLTLLDPLPEAISGRLALLLGWSLEDAVPRGVYSAALHVDNTAGQLVAQTDYALPTDPFGCAASEIDLSALPPGDYALYAAVYNWQTLERLPGSIEGAGLSADRLPMGSFVLR